MNKEQLVRAWAQQTGASHEDWGMDESLSTILDSQIYIGGVQGALTELQTTTETVLHVASEFLMQLAKKEPRS